MFTCIIYMFLRALPPRPGPESLTSLQNKRVKRKNMNMLNKNNHKHNDNTNNTNSNSE